jgi:uncharacterized protein
MNKIKLKILGISSGQTTSSYTLILEEEKGKRKLPVVIGAFEAQAIAIEIEKIEPVRPMTHDLFKTFATSFNVEIKEILIHRLHEGIFYAHIICSDGGKDIEIDARTSDAIAIALRFKCPIYTYEAIMQEAGIILSELSTEAADPPTEPVKKKPKHKKKKDLEEYNVDELKDELKKAIDTENYITAAKIRDEIEKREKGGGKGSKA